MEMGEFDLKQKLELMKKNWNKPGHKHMDMMNDIYEMIDDMATVLADFNRCECFWACLFMWFVLQNTTTICFSFNNVQYKIILLHRLISWLGGIANSTINYILVIGLFEYSFL
jgi:hypothetical protein